MRVSVWVSGPCYLIKSYTTLVSLIAINKDILNWCNCQSQVWWLLSMNDWIETWTISRNACNCYSMLSRSWSNCFIHIDEKEISSVERVNTALLCILAIDEWVSSIICKSRAHRWGESRPTKLMIARNCLFTIHIVLVNIG